MEALCKVSLFPSSFHSMLPRSSASSHLLRVPKTLCIRIEGKDNVSSEDLSVRPTGNSDLVGSDIGKLFADAHQNIMIINKQRTVAMEEVKRLKIENESLMEKLEEMGAEMERILIEFDGKNREPTSSWSLCELLLRIDSMVVSGLLSKEEAAEFRMKLMESKVAIYDILGDIHHKADAQLLSELRTISEKITMMPLHIVHICTEMEPVASYGSLATYVTGLSKALRKKGNLVEVILPKYSNLNLGMIEGLSKMEADFKSYFGGQWHTNRAWFGAYKDIGITLIEPLYYSTFFSREKFYGYSDDFERFLYFSRASLDYIVKTGKQPDVLHIHNWHTSIVGPLFWDSFVHQGLGSTRILLTCQDFKSQCLQEPNKLELIGLDPYKLHRADRLQDNNETNLVNILKGGIIYSNKVIVMSAIHSGKRLIHSLSHGLESTLAVHKEKLMVAPHGFDAQQWDPSRDKFLPRSYSADDMEGKKSCKEALLQCLSLSNCSSVVVGCIFQGQSEMDVRDLKFMVQNVMREGAQFVSMDCNSVLKQFQDELKMQDLKVIPRYDERLAHLIVAGCDIILCSSFDDPLFQFPLKAIKYGTGPLSLSSMTYDISPSEWHGQGSTNVSQYILSTFGQMSFSDALTEFKNDPVRWELRMKDGMTKDFSWDGECLEIHSSAYSLIKNM